MIVHAAGETGPAEPGTVAVLLECRDEAELRALAGLCRGSRLIVESEGPYAGQALAFACPPGQRLRALGHLRLWRGGCHFGK